MADHSEAWVKQHERERIRLAEEAKKTFRNIYCCTCEKLVVARLVQKHGINYWACDTCLDTVRCHFYNEGQPRPVGVIKSIGLQRACSILFRRGERLWKAGLIKKAELYQKLSEILGSEYSPENVKNLKEADRASKALYGVTLALGIEVTPHGQV